MTQLSDVLRDTDATKEAVSEMRFMERLEKLSELPNWKKEEEAEGIKSGEFGLPDIMRIFGCEK